MKKTASAFARRIALCLLGLLLAGAVPALGQEFEVSGVVTSQDNGQPLPGVNVVVQGTTTGTATDVDGTYELSAPDPQGTLVFSFVGYERQVIPINGRSVIDVQLAPDVAGLQEIVVVGYGTERKADLTGAIDVVEVEELTQVPTGEVLKALQGQASGVSIVSSGQPGAEPLVNIRGFNTFGNNEPLYIVDGVPTQNISTMNPNNIASMQVLKDAGAASIYGSRASNGVIIITTKEGRGEISVNYSAYVGYQMPEQNNVWDILSSQEMGELTFLVQRNSGLEPDDENWGTPLYGDEATPVVPDYILPNGAEEGSPEVDPSRYFVNPHYLDPNAPASFYQISRASQGTDWYDEIVSSALTAKHNLSVGGGGDIGNYFLSLGYLNQQGIVMQTYLERYSIRANTNFNVNDNIRIGENLSFTVSDNPTIAALTEGSAIGMSFREHPMIPVYDIMGNFAGATGTELTNARNPVAQQYRNRNNQGLGKRLFGNVFAEVDLLEDLLFRSSFGGELFSGYFHSFAYPTYENAENINTTPTYFENAWNGRNWTWSNTLTYQHIFADQHDVEVLAGVEAYKARGREVGGATQAYFSYDPNYWNLDTGSGTQTNYSFTYGNSLFSLFGRVDYSYAGKYLFGATLRRDGSSKFLENKYGVFPAVSAGWRISEEPFMEDLSWLTSLKLRGSYGVMGNQLNVDLNNPYTLFVGNINTSYYPITGCNNCLAQGFEQARIGNPDARWERDINMNVGFDVALFDGQMAATVDYYQKNIEGLLYNPSLPGTAGAAEQPFVNVGNMVNNGIDLSVNGTTTLFGDLNVDVGLTFTTYHNEIVEIAEGIDYFEGPTLRFGTAIIRNEVGHPLSAYYGYKIVGFWDTPEEIEAAGQDYQFDIGFERDEDGDLIFDDEGNPIPVGLGRFRYADVDGDGQITTADRTFLGSPHPDFTYGLNLGLAYKNWDFSMFLYGVQGNEIWNQVKWWTDFYNSFAGAKSSTALHDSWTPENHDATVAIQEEVVSVSTFSAPNSYFVEDGSYLRARSIQLGYTLPAQFVQAAGINTFRVYVQVANAFTITGYSGLDPEIGGNATSFGIDEGQYPNSRQFLVGIDLSF